jgi:hypothetical protein
MLYGVCAADPIGIAGAAAIDPLLAGGIIAEDLCHRRYWITLIVLCLCWEFLPRD